MNQERILSLIQMILSLAITGVVMGMEMIQFLW